jgi:uncharacterized protein (UPF0332 family)
MEKEKSEAVQIELDLALENFESSVDDVKKERYRRATSGFYFTLEHLAKALLLTVGVETESHGGVVRMLGLHFVKSRVLSPRVTRHLGNLYERRHTAEYSPRAAWEFTQEEVSTYLEWLQSSGGEILKELKKSSPDFQAKIIDLDDKLKNIPPP